LRKKKKALRRIKSGKSGQDFENSSLCKKRFFPSKKGKNTMMSSVKNARIIMSATRCISEIEKKCSKI
jgi:hypothetical protein